MQQQRPLKVHDFAAYFGLSIEYRDDLPDGVCGFLDPHPDPRYIAVNARMPEFDQMFTVAHEIGHLILTGCPRWPRLLDKRWRYFPLDYWARFSRKILYGRIGQELLADMVALFLMAGCGHRTELLAVLERYPNKGPWFLFVVVTSLVRNLPKLPYILVRRLLNRTSLA